MKYAPAINFQEGVTPAERLLTVELVRTMKTQAETIADLAVRCAGPSQFQNFDRAFRQSLAVSKEAILKDDARWKRARAKKRAAKKTG